MSTSKFLNSGPGSIGGLYIHPRHLGVKSGMRGWFGIDRAVLTLQNPEYAPSKDGLKRFQISGFDPAKLAMVDAALSYFVEAGMDNVTTKT